MTTRVLDTSVAAAWYLPEAFSRAAKQWQRRMLDGEVRFLVPSLHYWEIANVLRTYVVRRELEAGIACEIYALHLGAPLEVVEPERSDILKVALEYETTSYDAVYIALGVAHGVRVLTGEKSTTPWVTKLGDLVDRLS